MVPGKSMTRVIVDMSPSLDGFVAGTGISVEAPFGTADHRLHRWFGFDGTVPDEADKQAASQVLATAGAVVIGRRMFDVGIGLWGEDGAWGMPCFVVTNRVREPLVCGPTTFTFVAEGIEAAVTKARHTAGGKDVVIAGGGAIAQQCIAAGLVDELRLHVNPVLLGGGTPMFPSSGRSFELRLIRSVPSRNVVHQHFELIY